MLISISESVVKNKMISLDLDIGYKSIDEMVDKT